MSELEVRPGKSLGIVGRNGSGKTTLASKLAEENGVTLVSFELENELLEREIREDDSEFLNRIDFGRSVREMIKEVCLDGEKLKGIAERLGLSQILEQGFLTLSTGERRRLMLARALVKNPKLLVLDEPFDGLDQAFRQPLRDLLEGRDLVLVVNRLSDLEGLVDDVCCIEDGAVILNGSLEEVFKNEAFQQLMGLNDGELVLPKGESISRSRKCQGVDEKCKRCYYGGREAIFRCRALIGDRNGSDRNDRSQSGCGKSTLVNLVTGDHPQCYSNDVTVMGLRRGLGESIWDVKRHVGIISPSLHQQHRVSFSALQIVASGLFDSVGLYQEVSPEHWRMAGEWLGLVGMNPWADRPFRSLSYGQQRLLLVARALVKRPPLLVLDEPCQGLDPMNRSLVLGVIDRIASTKLTQILYITHEPEDRLECITHELKYVNQGWLIKKVMSSDLSR